MAANRAISTGRVQGGGFWSQPQVQYSQATQHLLKEMMKESRLTSTQQRNLEKSLRSGDGSLPLSCPPTHTNKPKAKRPPAQPPKVLNPKNYHSAGVRKKDAIEASGAYERDRYQPAPSHWAKNSEFEKERLANQMAFGNDLPPPSEAKRMGRKKQEPQEVPEIDRFDELQAEVDERRAFLKDMEGLGQGPKYRTIVETEISQLVREMEMIDKQRTEELNKLIAKHEAQKTKEES